MLDSKQLVGLAYIVTKNLKNKSYQEGDCHLGSGNHDFPKTHETVITAF